MWAVWPVGVRVSLGALGSPAPAGLLRSRARYLTFTVMCMSGAWIVHTMLYLPRFLKV